MKKVVIGRGRECNVILADTTDVVSRRQAVIAFSFFGKMTIYDTSSNGTFVNGQRLAKQEGKVVTRNDKINFCHVWDLDWTMVKDPYRGMKIGLTVGIVALLLVIGALFLFLPNHKNGEPEKSEFATDSLDTDTLQRNVQTTEPLPTTAEPPMQKKSDSNAERQKQNGKRHRGHDFSDSAYVEDYNYVDSVASERPNTAPLIY